MIVFKKSIIIYDIDDTFLSVYSYCGCFGFLSSVRWAAITPAYAYSTVDHATRRMPYGYNDCVSRDHPTSRPELEEYTLPDTLHLHILCTTHSSARRQGRGRGGRVGRCVFVLKALPVFLATHVCASSCFGKDQR